MRKYIGLFYLLSVSFWSYLPAQGNCDPSLPGIKESALGYRERNDRCEGLYVNQVSSTTLLVASFTEFFEDYDTNSGNALLIEWDKQPGNKNIHLRAQGIEQRLYYRMDTYRPPGNTFYAWPSGILASLEISRKDIGIVGRIKLPVGEKEREVYLPLRIRKQSGSKRTGTYKLTLLPGVQLSELYITMASVGKDGRPAAYFRNGEKLGYSYYPAERPIEIPIPAPKNAGVYYLQIGAERRSGGTKTIELWFYNPG